VPPHLVEVAFKGNRKEFFSWTADDPPPLKAAVIVDADRGEDLGYIHALGDLAKKRCGGCAHGCGTAEPARKALRLATAAEVKQARELRTQDDVARRQGAERVKAHGLVMKLSDAEWQWDRKKLTFYFTAEKRVDFRNLVRDLASMFRARIELKQIGVRDEAKRLDGIGRCGRQYCSAAWLPELRPVNLGVAKDQRLSLNPSQISGACGRLMCCLRYEHEFYVQSRKRFPKEGKIIVTARGEEKIVANDIFHDRVTLRSPEGETRVVALADLKRDQSGAATLAAPDPVDAADETDDTDLSVDTILDESISVAEAPARRATPRPERRERPPRIERPEQTERRAGTEPRAGGERRERTERPPRPDRRHEVTPEQATAAPPPPVVPPPALPVPPETADDAPAGDDVAGEQRSGRRRRGRRGGRRGRGRSGSPPDANGGDDTNEPTTPPTGPDS
jgi:cell fate regulator YaaT (PSP1 superfamily)